MQVVVHVSGFYEWLPVPEDVDTESAEFKKAILDRKVKRATTGWTMRVPKKFDTHVVVNVNEEDIVQVAIQEMTRGDRQYLNRVQCVTRLLARHVLPHMAHASEMQEFEIAHDAGPMLDIHDKLIAEHVECQNIDPADVDEMRAAYTEPATIDDHHDHLHKHFRIKPAKLATFREERLAREADVRKTLEHFHAQRAAAAKGADQ